MRYAGLDEVGVGALAGPICAAAVAMNVDVPFHELKRWWPLDGVRDSKLTTFAQREALYPRLTEFLLRAGASVGFGTATAAEVDELGHTRALEATKVAALRQVLDDDQVDLVVVDGSLRLPPRAVDYIAQRVAPKADVDYWLVAAASIIAKVRRDRVMREAARAFPQFGLDQNMGYGTPAHVHALRVHGPSLVHRAKATRTVLSK